MPIKQTFYFKREESRFLCHYRGRLRAEDSTQSGSEDQKLKNCENFLVISDLVTLDSLFDMFTNRTAAVVFSKMRKEKYGIPISCAKGLLTISDLNKHPVRHSLYGLLSELETKLSNLIRKSFQESWDWISKLNEDHQVKILGYWELSKRRDIDIGPIAATTLTQLINIVGKTRELLDLLGYRSKSEFDKGASKIPELRNCVMHLVRPLILGNKDVEKVHQTERFVQDLIDRLHKSNV